MTDKFEPAPARLFVWWWLCMVFASLRYDDAMHVKPKELLMSEEGLFGVAWQTKINRKRRGTKVRGPSREVQSFRLARGGLEALPARGSRQGPRVRDLNTRDEFRASPASYQRSLQWLKFFAEYSLNQYFQNQELRLKELISGLGSDYPLCSSHLARRSSSCRKINGGDRLIQANWKNPGPLVLKYTRNRISVPAQMVRRLDAVFDDVLFYVKSQGSRISHD